MDFKKELQTVNKEIKALAKKVEKLIIAAGKVENKNPKNSKSKSAKKGVGKKPDSKNFAKLSAADIVLSVIKKSKKGIKTAELIKKTGFNEKKIFNNVYKLRKQGKIKSEKKGVYMMA